ncbi:MAG: hypothetical protein ACEPOZ_10715 [Marinifilaceae bacterium]
MISIPLSLPTLILLTGYFSKPYRTIGSILTSESFYYILNGSLLVTGAAFLSFILDAYTISRELDAVHYVSYFKSFQLTNKALTNYCSLLIASSLFSYLLRMHRKKLIIKKWQFQLVRFTHENQLLAGKVVKIQSGDKYPLFNIETHYRKQEKLWINCSQEKNPIIKMDEEELELICDADLDPEPIKNNPCYIKKVRLRLKNETFSESFEVDRNYACGNFHAVLSIPIQKDFQSLSVDYYFFSKNQGLEGWFNLIEDASTQNLFTKSSGNGHYEGAGFAEEVLIPQPSFEEEIKARAEEIPQEQIVLHSTQVLIYVQHERDNHFQFHFYISNKIINETNRNHQTQQPEHCHNS